MDKQKLIGATLARYRKLAKLTQEMVSEQLGIDQGKLSRIERGKYAAEVETLDGLVQLYGLRLSEFMAVIEDESHIRDARASYKAHSMDGVAMVPLIGWVQAGTWTSADEPITEGMIETWVPTQAKVSARAYALEVEGESMVNPRGEPSFPPRTRIIVEPLAPVTSGAFVIAQIDDNLSTTFKKLVMEGDSKFLVPLNPQFPTMMIQQPVRICGVVVSKAEVPLVEA